MIITVSANDTLFSLSQKYSVPVSKIKADNGITGDDLIIGQSIILAIPEQAITTNNDTTVNIISSEYGISNTQLYRNNFILGGRQEIDNGSFIVLSYKAPPTDEKIIGGYAYDFISANRLFSVINYLTYIIPFTYGFTPEGALIEPEVSFILNTAKENDVMSLLHISTLTQEGYFDSNLPYVIFDNQDISDKLTENILREVTDKNYAGVDIDFEYLSLDQKDSYIRFTKQLSNALHEIGKILVIAVPPKVSSLQKGQLVEGIDYSSLGENADYILIMAYEYGYKFGPPLAIAPINQVTKVLDYATTEISHDKILLGISNYGYDWTLPYIRGESDAPSISNVQAIELAKKYGSEIQFDEESQAPFFFYTDELGRTHEVWFEDARSFEAKMKLIKEYDLAGGFIWDLMRENPQGYVTINSSVKIV